MQCESKRTIFDLFIFYDCKNCIYRKYDEHFNYINSFFHVYYLFSTCPISKNSEELFFYDKDVKRFFYDAIFFEKEIIFIILEEKELVDVFNYLDIIDNFKKDIQIIII